MKEPAGPIYRELSEIDLDLLMFHLLRVPEVIRPAMSMLQLELFDSYSERHYKLLWAISSQYFKEHGVPISGMILCSQIEHRTKGSMEFDLGTLDLLSQKVQLYYIGWNNEQPCVGHTLNLLSAFVYHRKGMRKLREAVNNPMATPSMIQDIMKDMSNVEVSSSAMVQPFVGDISKFFALTPRTPTGVTFLDTLLNGGTRPKEAYGFVAPSGGGKALALDTPLPTPTGWTTMGDVTVGDELFDDDGRRCTVTFATDVQNDRVCYRVEFNDGESIVCDAEHLWTVHDVYSNCNPQTLTTEVMSKRVYVSSGHNALRSRYRIPLAKALELSEVGLSIEPYVLGVWLGNGNCGDARITLNSDDLPEMVENIRSTGSTVDLCKEDPRGPNCRAVIISKNFSRTLSLQSRLRQAGLLNNKHIPAAYLRGSYRQRLSLLQGLLDTDGYCDPKGKTCEIMTVYPALADSIGELFSSLGIKYGRHLKTVILNGKECGPYDRFCFTVHKDIPVFRLKRKLACLKERSKTRPLCKSRVIVDIKPVPSVPVRCVQVDSESHLYLAGKRMVQTHNTTLSNQLAISCAYRCNPVFVFTYEQPIDNDYLHPIYVCASKIPRSRLKEYQSYEAFTQDDKDAMSRAQVQIGSYLHFFDFSGCGTVVAGNKGAPELEAKLVEMASQGVKPAGIIIDWFWHMVLRAAAQLGIDNRDLRGYAQNLLAELKQMAGRYNCWIWINQQTAAAEAGRKKVGEWNTAAELKSFANNLDFCFTLGALDINQFTEIKSSKARGNKVQKLTVQLDGEMATFKACDDNIIMDDRTKKFINKATQNDMPTADRGPVNRHDQSASAQNYGDKELDL